VFSSWRIQTIWLHHHYYHHHHQYHRRYHHHHHYHHQHHHHHHHHTGTLGAMVYLGLTTASFFVGKVLAIEYTNMLFLVVSLSNELFCLYHNLKTYLFLHSGTKMNCFLSRCCKASVSGACCVSSQR
jgi:hypothetical protein